MNFSRMLQYAVARRVAAVLVVAVLAWLGIGHARAQTPDYSQCYVLSNHGGESPANPICPTRQVAYEQGMASCEAYVASMGNSGACGVNAVGGNFYRFRHIASNGFTTIRAWFEECPPGYTWDNVNNTCNQPCDANAPPLSGGWVKGATLPYGVCVSKCTFSSETLPGDFNMTYKTVDGETYWSLSGWKPTGEACTTNDDTSTPPPPDADDDGVSDGNDPSPNNPGESGGTGDNPPSGDGNDSGDGSGNGNQSYGGGTCGAPPSSSGDAILAQIAFQTWATRCAIERAKDANGNLKTTQGGTGTGGTPGTGSGNGTCGDGPVNAAICATKDFAKKISDFVTGVTDEAAGLDTEHGELQEADSIWEDPSDGPTLNASLFGGGGSCPAPPTYMGKSLDPGGNLCMFASIIGALVLVAAYAQAAYIIGRA